MAELQKNIRRVGGELVSLRQPHGRRLLLPSEVEFCEVLNCTEDEYWDFVDKTAAYNGQRKEGYELIPDIRNEPVSAFLATKSAIGLTYGTIINIALIAIGYLLTPKPKPLKAGANVRGADSIGSKRFAPQFAFNSLQELANIGDVIPLVFCNHKIVDDPENIGQKMSQGGIRVNGQLLWSQLLSLGKLQQLKALVLFSSGDIDGKPDFKGYAIGDLLLSSYSNKKLDLFFKSNPATSPDNRITIEDKYIESGISGMDYVYNDVFASTWPLSITGQQPVYSFSGSRNPTTQSVFGLYSPMPNASVVKLSYELNYPVSKSSNPAKRAVTTKQKKINTFWPVRAGFVEGNVSPVLGPFQQGEEPELTYKVLRTSHVPVEGTDQELGLYPHGTEDVISMIRGIRENIDANLAVGETYMAGDGLVSCKRIETQEGEEGVPWRPTTSLNGVLQYAGIEREYVFQIEEFGTNYDAIGTPFRHPDSTLRQHESQPQFQPWDESQPEINGRKIRNKQVMTDYSLQYGFAYRNPVLQRVALGTITNSRSCAMTEIGLKSKVFGSIRGANLNAVPDKEALDQMFNDKTNFQLGTIDHFLKRFSFFYLQIRKAGTNDDWQTLKNTGTTGSNHSNLFCVRGNSPEFQYNYIKISHPTPNSQFEFRFKPYPGNNIPIMHLGQKVNLLNAGVTNQEQREKQFESNTPNIGRCIVSFAGQIDFKLETNELSNTEWKLSYNTGTGANLIDSGGVIGLSNYTSGADDLQIPGTRVTFEVNNQNTTPNFEPVEYEVFEDRKHVQMVSLNKDFDPVNGNWAWIVYENGVEVGVEVQPAFTPSTEISIQSFDGSNTYEIGLHPTVINHPEDPSIRVDYYEFSKSPNLTMTGST